MIREYMRLVGVPLQHAARPGCMSTTVGWLNIALGTVYTCFGFMTIVDMKRGWRTNGFSHFGFAWLAMTFTCGPHHLDHGIHILATGRGGGVLDFVAIAIGAPGRGHLVPPPGRGDDGRPRRPVHPRHPAVARPAPGRGRALPDDVARRDGHGRPGADGFDVRVTPNLMLIVPLRRHRLRHRPHPALEPPAHGRLVAVGTALATVMFTCALMHGVFALYVTTGLYGLDIHGVVIDWLSVPAAAYFLWVVAALHRGTLRDWNEADDVDGGRRPSRALVTATVGSA